MSSKMLGLLAAVLLASGTAQAACCDGADVGGTCYKNLKDAVAKSAGKTITIGGKVSVSGPIGVNTDLNIVGDPSCGSKPAIIANFDETERGLFELGGDGQTFKMRGVDMGKAKENGFASAIRTKTARNVVSLDLEDVVFDKFKNDINGSAIYIGKAGNVNIGKGCAFRNNKQMDPGEGGGTLYIEWLPRGSVMNLGGDWLDNYCLYSHCEGAAVFVETIEGKIDVTGTFKRNDAPDGAAVHFRHVRGAAVVNVGGVFENNFAENRGEGNRGGAVRTLTLSGSMTLSGRFVDNRAPNGRGGVIALNNIREKGVLTLSGQFLGNSVGSGSGAVLSASWTFAGKVVLDKAAVFQGNTGQKSSTLYYLQPCQSPAELCRTLAMKESEENYNKLPKETRTIVYTGPSVIDALKQYKAALEAEFGTDEKAQQEGLKKKYGSQWEKYWLSNKDIQQFIANQKAE